MKSDVGQDEIQGTGRFPWVLIATAVVGLFVVLALLRFFVFQAFYIAAPSMEPGIEVGDRVVVNLLDSGPERGDVVVYEVADPQPDAPTERIMRVVALGGDTIEAVDGRVLLNGEPLEEPYLDPATTTDDFGPVLVPEGQLFMMGDNRPMSSDSRFGSPIPEDSVVGTVIGG